MAHHSFRHHHHTHNPFSHPHLLDVILVCSNTQRYEARYRHFKRVQKELEANPRVRLTVVEMAFGERPWMIVDHTNSRHILLRNPDELWHKENLVEIGISRLPHDAKYVCWMDADVTFLNADWAEEVIETLQHYQVIQPWTQCLDLGPNGETFATHESFCYKYYLNPQIRPKDKSYYGNKAHPGYVWAARREALDMLGGVITTAILGSGDINMAYGLIGLIEETIPEQVTAGYKAPLLEWQYRALYYIKKNIGYMPGTIIHHFHGPKRARQYVSRWKILIDYQFDPATDLVKDWQGLWRLRVENTRQIGLRDALRKYMSTRDEDDIRLD